jgi:hypothetical protein
MRTVLTIAPPPAEATKLSVCRIAAARHRTGRGRSNNLADAEMEAGLSKVKLRQPLLVAPAMGKHVLALGLSGLAAFDYPLRGAGGRGERRGCVTDR